MNTSAPGTNGSNNSISLNLLSDSEKAQALTPAYMISLAATGQKQGSPTNRLWSQAVNLYCAGNLPHSSDRLVAISGVAKWFQRHNNDIFMAGMWKTNLETQLLWEVRETENKPLGASCRSELPSEYIAPSWSWASVNEPIRYRPGFHVTEYNDREETWTQHITIISAELQSVSLHQPFRLQRGALHVSFDDIKTEIIRPGHTLGRWVSLDFPIKEEKRVYYLLIIKLCDRAGRDICFKEGIVLERLEPGIFRRSGYWHTAGCSDPIPGESLDDYSEFNDGEYPKKLTIV